MKVNLNLNQPKTGNKINFEGYKPVKSIEQGKLEILEWLKSEKF